MKFKWIKLRLLLWQIGLIALAWGGTYEGNIYSWRVVTFLSWAALIWVLLSWAPEKTREATKQSYKDGKHLPVWVDFIHYLAMVGIFVSHGHVLLGIVWTFIGLWDGGMRQISEREAKDEQKESEDTAQSGRDAGE